MQARHLRTTLNYLHYWLKSSNGKGHGTHSPFVFNFIQNVLNDRTQNDIYESVEKLRAGLLKDQTVLHIEDYGAGSTISKSPDRTIASIARHALKPKKYGQLLYRIVHHYRPKTILELGTSLGITTSYLAIADPAAQVITMEGAGAVAAVAQRNIEFLSLKNVEIVRGNFDDTLSSLLDRLTSVDMAFIDGNHRRAPTERYFNQLLPKTTGNSILIFDDIHWSNEMEEAWNTIREHPAVTSTIDIFFVGIVLFRKEFLEKQHFVIRF